MSLYAISLFVHVVSDIGMFVGVGVWVFGLIMLRRISRVEQIRPIVAMMELSERTYSVAGPLLLLSGIYMTVTVWGWETAWINVALGSILLMIPLGPVIVAPRIKAIHKAAEETPDGPLPQALAAQISDPLMSTAQQTMACILFGVVFLMTTKPDLVGSLVVILVSVVVGALTGLPLWLSGRRKAASGASS
jgi:hypothetical protein